MSFSPRNQARAITATLAVVGCGRSWSKRVAKAMATMLSTRYSAGTHPEPGDPDP